LHRRDFILGAASACALAASVGSSLASRGEYLRQIAASKGLLFGSAMRLSSLRGKTPYSEMMASECSLYVCGDMQWRLVALSPSATDFSKVDAAKAWARAHDMRFRGHSLLWHQQTPSWFAEIASRESAIAALQAHIRQMCSHFKGSMQSWDVINEPIQTSCGSGMLRKSVFTEKIGPEFLDIAFHTAREADSKALLTLNEYGTEYNIPDHLRKRRELLNLIDGFKSRGTPIDAIGIQSHLSTGRAAETDQESIAGFFKEISDRGLKIMLTELDVVDRASPADIATRDREVAQLYKRYLDAALENRAVIAVVTWGLTDKDSWITRGDDPKFRRPDGLPARPLPFDDHFRRKPAYEAIAAALQAAPSR